MENYEVVLAKTVRDLFTSTSLNQIRKYKQNKEKEILKKEEEIKSLILEKYPLLIKSINSFEQISNHLSDLQEIRKVLAKNIDNFRMYRNSEEKDNESFDIEKLFEILENCDVENELDDENLQDDIDKCWDLLRENEFDKLIMILIKIESSVKLNKILYSNYELLLVEFMNTLIKNNFNYSNCKSLDLDNFLLHCFTIFYCFTNINRLTISEQYFKLQKNDLINLIIKDCFEISCKEDTSINLKTTFEFFIKLMILKISKLFSEMNNIRDSFDIKYNLILNISYLINFYLSLFISSNNSDSLSESSGEYLQEEKIENQSIFNVGSFLKNLRVLFSNIDDFNVQITNISDKMKLFFDMIKKELLKYLKLDNNLLYILELCKKLLINLSLESSFSNHEINNILMPLSNLKSFPHNTNLLLFDILYYDYFSDCIKNCLNNILICFSIENYSKNIDNELKGELNDSVFEKIFLFFETLLLEKSHISLYFKEFLNLVTVIITEFLDKTISFLQSNENVNINKSEQYEYIAYIFDKLFKDSVRNTFNNLGLNSLIEKLNEIRILFTNVKKHQIEADIFSKSLYMLKIENFLEINNQEMTFNITSTLRDTIYNISVKYFPKNSQYDFDISYCILFVLIKFYQEFLNSHAFKREIYNHNIFYDLCLLEYLFKEFDKKETIVNRNSFPNSILNDYINSYKGEIKINPEDLMKIIDERLKNTEEISLNESFILEFFFNDNKYFFKKQQVLLKENILQEISKIKTIEKTNNHSEQITKEKLKEYFVSSHHKRNELSQIQVTTIEKNRLKSLTSFKLLSLKMEENFLSIKDDSNSKNKLDRSKSGIGQNIPIFKNENSGYLGFLGNVIQNNNQSISSFISKFTNFNK